MRRHYAASQGRYCDPNHKSSRSSIRVAVRLLHHSGSPSDALRPDVKCRLGSGLTSGIASGHLDFVRS